MTPQVQFLGEVGRARRCATTGAEDGPDSVNTVEVPQLQFTDSRRHSCCGTEANPCGPVF